MGWWIHRWQWAAQRGGSAPIFRPGGNAFSLAYPPEGGELPTAEEDGSRTRDT